MRVVVVLALMQFACASTKSNEDISLEEKAQSWNLVLVVTLLGVCIFCTYLLLTMGTHMRWVRYLPESVVTIILGVMAGTVLTLSGQTLSNLVTFDPQTFFTVMLPPIIFESGYSLHKGDFFSNLGSILVFAVLGTLISTLVVGFGAYGLGTMGVSYPLSMLDALTFGSLISATDPVATLAIFHALDVDPTLYILVFGESVLNDAVAVVMFRTLLSFYEHEHESYSEALLQFMLVSLFSGVVGVIVALFSALVFKLTHLYQHPSLETALMFIFAYLPYMLAEALNLSGIMAILFCGIVMSHYTHFNLSPATQLTCNQTFRTVALISETAIFAYMGLSLPTLHHTFHTGFIISGMVLILVGRALNIFPLAALINRHNAARTPAGQPAPVGISSKEQFIMWFSGLRGAIAFSLVLNMQSHSLTAVSPETKSVLVTTTLIIVLATIFIFGGGTAPLLEYVLNKEKNKEATTNSHTNSHAMSLMPVSKLSEMPASDNMREAKDGEWGYERARRPGGFAGFDHLWLIPIFRIADGERASEQTRGSHARLPTEHLDSPSARSSSSQHTYSHSLHQIQHHSQDDDDD